MSDDNITKSERAKAARLCNDLGETKAAKALNMGRDTLLRILADRPVRRGTVVLLRHSLAALK